MSFLDPDRSPYLLAMVLILMTAGCSGSSVELGSSAHEKTLHADHAVATGMDGLQADQSAPMSLSLQQAIDRAIEKNLDARVAALEALTQQNKISLAQLQALPGVKASYGYSGRSDDGASSSRSVITGNQSLEASQSADAHRRNADLEVSWNLIDAALAFSEAAKADDEAGIAAQRHIKVIQNVERDVYNAYWRARAFQDVTGDHQDILRRVDDQIAKLDEASDLNLVAADEISSRIAALIEKRRSYADLYDDLKMAAVEIRSILSLPLEAQVILTTARPDLGADVSRSLNSDISDLEWSALRDRPEIREEILSKNVSLEETRREVLRTFPGFEFLFSHSYDSNQFLEEASWNSVSASIVQSVTNILTLPSRHRAARNREMLADARRHSMVAAVLAQVRISRYRLESAAQGYRISAVAARAAGRKGFALGHKREKGLASGESEIAAALDARIERMREGLAYAELQDSYAAMNAVMGRGLSSNIRISLLDSAYAEDRR